MTDTAVIVVDMQRGLVQRATPAYRLDDVVSGINRLTAAARAARAPVCFVQHDGDAADDIVPGTPGWELHRGLVVEAGDWRIRKRMSDAFHDTPLAAQLDRHGIRSVLICGYATEFCVDAAARRCSATARPSCRICIRRIRARTCRPSRSSRIITSSGKTVRCRATR